MACIFSKYDDEQRQLLLHLKEDEHVKKIEYCKKIIRRFTTFELIHWPYDSKLQKFIIKFVFTIRFSKRQNLNSIFEFRIVQHNIRIISLYYTQISTKRLAELLRLNSNLMEKFVSEMVITKNIYASIDRLTGNISFKERENVEQTIDQWIEEIDKIIHILEAASCKIQKEMMIQKIIKNENRLDV